MDPVDLGAAALANAETEIKRLTSEAVAANQWSAVATLAGWARTLRSLLEGDDAMTVRGSRQNPGTGGRAWTGELNAAAAGPEVERGSRSRGATGSTARGADRPGKEQGAPPARSLEKVQGRNSTEPMPRRATERAYPKFVRDGDVLVKIGWSKKGRTEYEHRAPRIVIDQIVGAIAKLGANGVRFSVEQLLPLLGASDGEGTPNYQTYLCIAWLREQALLEQRGRQGYSSANTARLKHLVDEAWTATPRRA